MGKLDIHMSNNKVGHFSNTMYKNQCKINKRAETIELLEENTREKLHDLAFGNHFLYMTSKAQATKEKNR